MVEAAISAAQQLAQPAVLLSFVIMIPIALLSGLMPGGSLPVAVVVLGFAGHLDPWVAVPLVVFYFAATDITQPIPSILMGIPGARSAQATILDGYPMTKRGEAGVALGASYTCTLVGGVLGGASLFLFIPVAREVLRFFSAPEFFLLSFVGILAVAVISAGALVKGLLIGCFAVGLSMIGTAPVGGTIRATFGIDYLWDGLALAPVAIGLFAIPEVVDMVVRDTPLAQTRVSEMLRDARQDVRRGMREAFSHSWLMVRSSLIGTLVGALPAIGGSGAHWIAYAQARQTVKGGIESFGKGDVRGVIAADSANNSSDGGQLIPTLFFGIPGSGGMAMVMAIMALSGGIVPGPAMVNEHLDLTVGLVFTIVVANIIVVPIVLWGAPLIVRIAAVPPNILAPIVIGLVTLAAFMATVSMGDLVMVLALGALGMFMKAYGWPRPPILIAVVLASPMERYLSISMNAYDGDVAAIVLRPAFLVILALLVLTIVWGSRGGRRIQMRAAEASSRVGSPDLSDEGTE